jgi:chemotaxis protein methyltransferase CheR
VDDEVQNVRPITETEFTRFRTFIYDHAGISLSPEKRQLVAGRLLKRLNHHGFKSYGDYFRFVMHGNEPTEKQILVDCLTTNETYFFREPAHFDYLATQILPHYRGKPFRLWSAACSTGEEVYTLAIVLAETLGRGDWKIVGSDISSRVLQTARQGVYPMDRATGLPKELLNKYCLKGVRSQAGSLMVIPKLKERVSFKSVNLKEPLKDSEQFDVIFLRNVLIYFDIETKRDVVTRVTGPLRPGGHLFVSHVESLHGVVDHLEMIKPSIFRKPAH